MIKISFILPMYRAEKYLARVVQSLKEQTMPDFEAIFVDDGSPDRSAALCTELFAGDARFRLIRKENGGVSSARNAGLDCAAGKYVLFVDPDDCIASNAAQLLWECAEREGADIVFFGRRNDYYRGDALIRSAPSLPRLTGVYRDHPCQKCFEQIATAYFVTDKLFRRELIERRQLRFQDVNIGEDGIFFAEYIREGVSCAVFLPETLYHYTVQQSASLSSSYHPEREADNFRLSGAIRETVRAWGLIDSPAHRRTLQYCTVRDLQLGIKNINLGPRPFNERVLWLRRVLQDDWVRGAVRDTPLSMAESRNDRIKLLLMKMHMLRLVIYVSSLNQKR